MEKFEMTRTYEISDQNIDDLMVTALEGGINYWCSSAVVSVQPLEDWKYTSDVISLTDGVIQLTDIEDENITWELTIEKFMNGLKLLMSKNNYIDVNDLMDNHDAEIADHLIQLSLFGKIVFG